MMASNFPEYWQSPRIFVRGWVNHLLMFYTRMYASTKLFLTQEHYRSSTKTSDNCSQHSRPRTKTEVAVSWRVFQLEPSEKMRG